MKLKQEIIQKVRASVLTRRRLRAYFKVSRQSIHSWLSENKPEGKLTTMAAAQIISESLELDWAELYDKE